MELQTIQTTTTWNEAAGRINSNNQKIDLEVEKLKNATYKNKGYFKTLSQLQSAYPTASAGSRAYVGMTYPFLVYWWSGSSWVHSGETGGEESLDLSQYYTKEEVEAAIADYNTVLTQDLYDRLLTKEDKLYFTYETEEDFDFNPIEEE
jgi:hypothetical protein